MLDALHQPGTQGEGGEAPRRALAEALLYRRLASRTATVAVIGLGYVGLPLALAVTEAGFRTLGFDRDVGKLTGLAAGQSPLRQLPAEALRAALRSGRFLPAHDEDLGAADAVLICVPTPLGRHREPDLSCVEDAARQIARHLRPGQLVVLESTTWPGTTREVVLPILEATGLACGRDFFLAYSPEREDPGNVEHRTVGIPKVVGGADPASLRLAQALYGAVVERTVPVDGLETAEAVKLTENVFRAVNIALVNELKLVFGAMGLDVWKVIEAAATKPFGYMPFWPGPGPGGHCIPVDPFYLAWKARAHGLPTRFVELAGEVNGAMPDHILDRLARALDATQGRGLRDSRILLLGVGYKRNLEDVRESPALRLMEVLEARGAAVDYFDPLVPRLPPLLPDHPGLAGRRSIPWPEAVALRRYHAALIVTDHDGVDYAALVAEARLVVDTRNVCARLGLSGQVVTA
jgi:UDP-N-acetyl-D-glucosamine dehydrogenase